MTTTQQYRTVFLGGVFFVGGAFPGQTAQPAPSGQETLALESEAH